MKRKLLLFIYSLGCCIFLQSNVIARESCALVPISLEQRTGQAAVIVEGKVVEQHSFWDEGHQRIYTSNIVEVYKAFKGNLTGSKIEIITEGGTVGNQRMVLSSTLSLSNGQTGLFFCMPHSVMGSGIAKKGASYMVYSSQQGFIEYVLNEGIAADPFQTYKKIEDARKAVRNVTKADYRIIQPVSRELERAEAGNVKSKTTLTPVIASFLPLTSPGGTGALLTITGSNFGASQGTGFVEFPNADNGGTSYVRPLATDYISWNNTTIVVKVPSTEVVPGGTAGTGLIKVTNSDPATGTSTLPFTITYTWSNINDGGVATRADLVNDNTTGGYSFQYYTTFSTNAPATAAFVRAMKSWCPTQVNWIVGAATAVNVAASDGTNIVRFDIGGELPVGVLGRLTSYYSGCGPVGGPYNWFVAEMDVVFDDGANWQYGPGLPAAAQSDFESVALHELGHGIQLSHVINSADVMHYALTTGTTRRILNVDDLAGGNNVTATSILPNVCGSTPMILLPCPLAVKVVSFKGKYIAGDGAALEWLVATQEDIDGYRVEKSLDGVRFETIGFLKSSGTAEHTYNYTDKTFDGNAYYRLTVVEINASLWSTNIVHLRTKGADEGVSIYPNPARNTVTFSSGNADMAGATVVIVGTDGRVVREYNIMAAQGATETTVSIEGLVPGVYFYRLNTKSGDFSGTFVKE